LNRSYEAYEAATAYIETTVRLRFQEVQLIVGLASAGVSWAARISSRLRLPMSFVRTVQKKYGIGKLVEGNPENNAKAVIIDDLCGGGDTIFNAIEALKSEYQVQTLGVVTITNWCFKHMWERFDPINVKVHSLTSYPHILRIGVRTGRLTEEQAAMLREFYRAPLTYDWPQISKDNQKP